MFFRTASDHDPYLGRNLIEQDFSEPGNRPETAETCTEWKEEATELSGKNTFYIEEAKSRVEDISNTEEPTAQILSNAFVPTVQTPNASAPAKSGSSSEVAAMGLSNDSVLPHLTIIGGSNSQACNDGVLCQQYNSMVTQDTEVSSQDFAFPAQEGSNMSTNGKKDQGMLYGNPETGFHSNSGGYPHGNGVLQSPSSGSSSSVNSGGKLSRWQSPEMQNQIQGLMPQYSGSRLGGVLQALQHAKASLGQLSGLPLPNQGTLATVAPTDSHVRTIKYGGDLDIPIGPTGLFRLPTDSYPQAAFPMPKFYGPGSSLASTHSDVGYAITPSEYRYPTSRYVESGPRVSIGMQYFDPYITSATGVLSSTRYSLPYSHLTTERTPSQDGFSTSRMDLRNEMPAGDRYLLNGANGALPSMRRL